MNGLIRRRRYEKVGGTYLQAFLHHVGRKLVLGVNEHPALHFVDHHLPVVGTPVLEEVGGWVGGWVGG